MQNEKQFDKRLNVQLDTEMFNRLESLSAQTNVPSSEIIRRCIDKGLDGVRQDLFEDPNVQTYLEKMRKVWGEALTLGALHKDAPRPKDSK